VVVKDACLDCVLQHIMHDWNDENCLKILNNCQRVLPEKGKVLIFDFVVPPNGGRLQLFDMLMMAFTDGGIERTEEQWRKLLTTAGFSTINYIELLQNHWLIEVVK
jgi:caffeic acid 3-O-methyltransferase